MDVLHHTSGNLLNKSAALQVGSTSVKVGLSEKEKDTQQKSGQGCIWDPSQPELL